MVRAGADFSAITKQAQRAGSSMTGMRRTMEQSCRGMNVAMNGLKATLGVLGVSLTAVGFASLARDAREAYAEMAEGQAKLAQVMRNTMGAGSAQVKQINELIEQQERLGVVEGAAQTAGAQELATYLSQTESLKRLIPVMNDMVAQQYGLAASGEQVTGVATMLGKVMEGQLGGLSRYGYYFDEAQAAVLKYGTEAERVAVLADVVEGSVGGMNAALAATPEGRLRQAALALDNIKESFGEAVSVASTAFIPALNGICNILADAATLAGRVAQALANVFGGGGATAQAVTYTGGAAAALEDAEDAANGTASGLEGAVAAAKKLQTFSFDTLNKFAASSSSSGGGGGALGGGSAIQEALMESAERAEGIKWLEEALSHVKETLGSIDLEPLRQSAGRLKESLSGLARVAGEYLGSAYDNVLLPLATWAIEGAAPASVEALAATLDALRATLDACKPAFDWLLTDILGPLGDMLQRLQVEQLGRLTSSMSKLADGIDSLFGDGNLLQKVDGFAEGLFGAIDGISSGLTDSLSRMGEEAMAGFLGGINGGDWRSAITNLFRVGVIGLVGQILGITTGNSTVTASLGLASMRGFLDGLKQGWTTVTTWLDNAITRLKQSISDVLSGIKSKLTLPSINVGGVLGLKIPAGASGMVLPPNQPHLAIVGDQTGGTNVETPLAVMTDAMLAALRVNGYGSNDEQTALLRQLLSVVRQGKVIQVDGKELGRTVRRELADGAIALGI